VGAIGQYPSVETDAELIVASVVDPSRFEAIFDRHFAEIDRYLARRIGAQLADDLAADTFVVAFRSRARYDANAPNARPWLYGIAANLARRHWRTERRRLRAYARTGADPLSSTDVDEVERRIDALAAGPALAGALAALKPRDREILLLFAWADLSYEEIATALAIPVGTVRSRLSRTRARVRNQLDPNGQVAVERATEGGSNG
jgi:RNA polymerase sigma-70 factor (ECF subfamily)